MESRDEILTVGSLKNQLVSVGNLTKEERNNNNNALFIMGKQPYNKYRMSRLKK